MNRSDPEKRKIEIAYLDALLAPLELGKTMRCGEYFSALGELSKDSRFQFHIYHLVNTGEINTLTKKGVGQSVPRALQVSMDAVCCDGVNGQIPDLPALTVNLQVPDPAPLYQRLHP